MKKIIFISMASFLLSLLTGYSFAEDKIIAKVGDTVIKESQLEEALEKYKPSGSFHNVSPEKRQKFKKDALNDLIEFELLYKEAKKRGIKVKSGTIDDVIEENVKKFGSKKKFIAVLKKQGMILDEFKERVRKYHMVITLLNTIFRDVEYKEDELREYYEKNKQRFRRPESIHLYHILIKVDPTATEEEWVKKKKYAEEILDKIRSGSDFGEVAYNYSEDPYKFKSGDLGFVHREQLEPNIEKVAFSLKEGEMSGIVRSIYGFHILKAGEKRPETMMTFDEVKEKLKKELDTKRFEEKREALLGGLKKEYAIEIYIKFEEEGKN